MDFLFRFYSYLNLKLFDDMIFLSILCRDKKVMVVNEAQEYEYFWGFLFVVLTAKKINNMTPFYFNNFILL